MAADGTTIIEDREPTGEDHSTELRQIGTPAACPSPMPEQDLTVWSPAVIGAALLGAFLHGIGVMPRRTHDAA